MARKPRIFCESQNYHIILRGNNKQLLFYDEDDRFFFIKRLEKYATELNIYIFSYCLMSNHVHILLGNANPLLSKFVQKLATSYAMRFNRKYERTGHLFEGRFKSEPVESVEYFKTAIRYILQNPLKSKIADFKKYKWSSYLQTIEENAHSLINTEYLLCLFDSKKAMIDFINQTETKECMEYENKVYLSDKHCIEIIEKTFAYSSPTILSQLAKEEQFEKLKILMAKGFSINQISRITNISRGVIRRASQ